MKSIGHVPRVVSVSQPVLPAFLAAANANRPPVRLNRVWPFGVSGMGLIPLIFLSLFLAGCGNALKRNSVAHISPDLRHGYEIELSCSYRSFGGPCNFPQLPHRISESHWLYTDRIEGEVSTNHLILTYERGKTEYPWAQEALHVSAKIATRLISNQLRTFY